MRSRRLILIGQAPAATLAPRPFGRTRLYRWFEEAGIQHCEMAFTALVENFLGKRNGRHKIPSPADISENKARLIAFIRNNLPGIIVPVGKLAGQTILNKSSGLKALVGQRFSCNPFGAFETELVVIVLPHPSGANPWIYVHERNRALWRRSLELLHNELMLKR